VVAGKLAGKDKIGVRVGKIINQYKVPKHFDLTIKEVAFSFKRKDAGIAAEAALNGLYRADYLGLGGLYLFITGYRVSDFRQTVLD
jgi:hypothetical protein